MADTRTVVDEVKPDDRKVAEVGGRLTLRFDRAEHQVFTDMRTLLRTGLLPKRVLHFHGYLSVMQWLTAPTHPDGSQT